MESYNIIAIGGTGMRCAESFVHLCAMGMFDNTEINLLALDTDYENGNFLRLKTLIGAYNGIYPERKGPLENTLFSSIIRYYEFSPNYGAGTNFNSVSGYSTSQTKIHDENGVKWKESDLVDLSLTTDMREMDLQHGYRAQTQMGSMLMYHAVLEEAYKYKEGATKDSHLCKFIENLMNTKGSKVFIFGSVFGGTGASSIPILPRALQKAAQIISKEGQADIITDNFFGTVMLTSYFQFGTPTKQGKVVATSDQFAFNSQAALFFYNNDKTVKRTYKRLYLIGRENLRDLKKEIKSSVTGGSLQRNPVDYIELLAASAAYDFFKAACKQPNDFGSEGEVFYRTIESDENENLTFKSFFGEDAEKFAEKCGIMTASAFLYGAQYFAEDRMKSKSFNSLTDDDIQPLHTFMRSYYDLMCEGDEREPGWIKQMQESVLADGYKGFLFSEDVFNTDVKKVKNFNYDEKLFGKESQYSKNYVEKKGFGGSFKSAFDTFKNKYGEQDNVQDLQNTMENLLKRTYSTFRYLFGFA